MNETRPPNAIALLEIEATDYALVAVMLEAFTPSIWISLILVDHH